MDASQDDRIFLDALEIPSQRRRLLRQQLDETRQAIRLRLKGGCSSAQFEDWKWLLLAIETASQMLEVTQHSPGVCHGHDQSQP